MSLVSQLVVIIVIFQRQIPRVSRNEGYIVHFQSLSSYVADVVLGSVTISLQPLELIVPLLVGLHKGRAEVGA